MRKKNLIRIVGDTAILLIAYKGETHEILISAEDVETVSQYRWRIRAQFEKNGKPMKSPARYIAGHKQTPRGTLFVYLHRLIMQHPEGMVVDHVNGNTLDNRRSNLRIVTPSQNGQNRKSTSAASGVRNVYRHTYTGRYFVSFCVGYRRIQIGTYETLFEASQVAERERPRVLEFSSATARNRATG